VHKVVLPSLHSDDGLNIVPLIRFSDVALSSEFWVQASLPTNTNIPNPSNNGTTRKIDFLTKVHSHQREWKTGRCGRDHLFEESSICCPHLRPKQLTLMMQMMMLCHNAHGHKKTWPTQMAADSPRHIVSTEESQLDPLG